MEDSPTSAFLPTTALPLFSHHALPCTPAISQDPIPPQSSHIGAHSKSVKQATPGHPSVYRASSWPIALKTKTVHKGLPSPCSMPITQLCPEIPLSLPHLRWSYTHQYLVPVCEAHWAPARSGAHAQAFPFLCACPRFSLSSLFTHYFRFQLSCSLSREVTDLMPSKSTPGKLYQ